MSTLLNEKQVLEKLGITDFRHMTKDKLISFVSMLDEIDPEVAKKTLEQFPDFARTSKEIFSNYKVVLEETIKSNDRSLELYHDICITIIEMLKNEVEDENLTFEEKKYIIEQMKVIVGMTSEKDTENKHFYTKIIFGVGTVVIITMGLLAAVLGGNMTIFGGTSDG